MGAEPVTEKLSGLDVGLDSAELVKANVEEVKIYVPSDKASENAALILKCELCTQEEYREYLEVDNFLRLVDSFQLVEKFLKNKDYTAIELEELAKENNNNLKHHFRQWFESMNPYLAFLPSISTIYHQILKATVANDRNFLRELEMFNDTEEVSSIRKVTFKQFEENFSNLLVLGEEILQNILKIREKIPQEDKYADVDVLYQFVTSNFYRNLADIYRYKIQIMSDLETPTDDNEDVKACIYNYQMALETSGNIFPKHANEAFLSASLNKSVFFCDVLDKLEEAIQITKDAREKCQKQLQMHHEKLDGSTMNNIHCLLTLLDSNRVKWTSGQDKNLESDEKDSDN